MKNIEPVENAGYSPEKLKPSCGTLDQMANPSHPKELIRQATDKGKRLGAG
ncbi:MAG: hypothetical protein ACU84H_04320 [Gammaproteobacteria bacterium]